MVQWKFTDQNSSCYHWLSLFYLFFLSASDIRVGIIRRHRGYDDGIIGHRRNTNSPPKI
jgi:hypothetical protein